MKNKKYILLSLLLVLSNTLSAKADVPGSSLSEIDAPDQTQEVPIMPAVDDAKKALKKMSESLEQDANADKFRIFTPERLQRLASGATEINREVYDEHAEVFRELFKLLTESDDFRNLHKDKLALILRFAWSSPQVQTFIRQIIDQFDDPDRISQIYNSLLTRPRPASLLEYFRAKRKELRTEKNREAQIHQAPQQQFVAYQTFFPGPIVLLPVGQAVRVLVVTGAPDVGANQGTPNQNQDFLRSGTFPS